VRRDGGMKQAACSILGLCGPDRGNSARTRS